MQKNKYIYLIGLLLFTLSSLTAKSPLSASLLKERLEVFTDRTIYASGEHLFLNVNYHTNMTEVRLASLDDASQSLLEDWSKVLYVELVGVDGSALLREKVTRTGANTSGVITLPATLVSGAYYLKIYTRWMRNYSPQLYSFTKVLVINPASSLEEGSAREGLDAMSDVNQANPHLNLTLSDTLFAKRGLVHLSLQNDTSAFYISASVVKKNGKQMVSKSFDWDEVVPEYPMAKYYPDLHSNFIRGRVTDLQSNPQPEKAITLSSIRSQSFFSGAYTNANGEFYFSFPENQVCHDYYLGVNSENDLDIVLDEGWCTRSISATPTNDTINEKAVRDVIVNAQLSDRFGDIKKTEDVSEDSVYTFFYGKPDVVYYVQNYINLPNVKELITELVPDLSVKTRKDKVTLSMANYDLASLPLLLLVDNIPINDYKSVLAIPLVKVEKLELVRARYICGELKYGSIVSVITKEHSLAGLDLPKNSMFFNYKVADSFEGVSQQPVDDVRIPDRRNCLFWTSGVELGNAPLSYEFTTADVSGEYDVIIQSISKETGKVYYDMRSFVVR